MINPITVLNILLGQSSDAKAERIILGVRSPRILTAILVGASLGMAGAVFQSISRNALGSPDILGFTTGAATGAIIQIVLFNAGPYETAAAAVLSGLLVAVIIYALSLKSRTTGGHRIILVGIGAGAVLSGVNTILLVMGDLDQAMSAQLWLAGSLNTRTWSHVGPAAVGFFVILPVLAYQARYLKVIEMGDETAAQLGVSVERSRFVFVMAGVCLSAAATAAAGPIAFIALVAPQLARRLVRAPHAPIFSGAIMGATLLIAADLLVQRFPLTINVPIGSMTGILGGLYLLWILVRSSGR